jgi:hypothetical protein
MLISADRAQFTAAGYGEVRVPAGFSIKPRDQITVAGDQRRLPALSRGVSYGR